MSSPQPPAAKAAPHEQEIARLFASQESADWRLPMQLAAALPFAAFTASVEQPTKHSAPVLVVEAVLPCPEATEPEAARFRISRTIPRFVIRVSESQWCSTCSFAALFGVPLTPVPALTLLVGERLAILEPPAQGRPFLPKWTEAIAGLARAVTDMHWQALAVSFDRSAVHKTTRSVRDDARLLGGGWGVAGRTGVTP